MRFNDTVTGILLFVFGLAVAGYAQTFPPSPGQNIGPGLFPTLMGGALALCGLVLFFSGRRKTGEAPVQFDEWVGRPRMVLNGALVIASLIFYALIVDITGFFVAAFVFLTVLLLAFGVPRKWIPVLSITVTFGLHFVFYNLLRVPLPWGWFEGIAW